MISLSFTGNFEATFQAFLQQMQMAGNAGLFTDRFQFSKIYPGDLVTDPSFSFSTAFKGSFVPASVTGTITSIEADYTRSQLGVGITKLWSLDIGGLNLDLRQAFSISGSSYSLSTIGLKLGLAGQAVTFNGTVQDDVFGPNSIFALTLDDTLNGGDGRDALNGGGGKDRVAGGTGFDTLFGGALDDRLFGGTGRDVLNGDDGRDRLYGEGSNDRLAGARAGHAVRRYWR